MGIGQRKSHKSKMFRDGRIVLSPTDWKHLKLWMWGVLNLIYEVVFCHICNQRIWEYCDFEPDHETPRGLGGGTRDDRFLKPSHSWCNHDKGSRRTNEVYKPCPPKAQNEGTQQ